MIETISPIDNTVCFSTEQFSDEYINTLINKSVSSHHVWKQTSLDRRIDILNQFLDEVVSHKETICQRLSIEMGRPIKYCYGEINGFLERAKFMIEIAPAYLRDITIFNNTTTTKAIHRVPLGVILIIPAWNYPYLTSINSLITALLSGNSVIFKGSSQTPFTGEIYQKCFRSAGLPENVFTNLYLDHKTTGKIVSDNRINSVSFTGSVNGGCTISNQANDYNRFGINKQKSIGFKTTTLELGGKDPAYVRSDADLEFAANEISSGTFFNSGQCCCAVERVYVHHSVYHQFLDLLKKKAEQTILGNPLDSNTTMGPMAKKGSADHIRTKIQQAIKDGAQQIVNQELFPLSKHGSNYLSPHILINVNHDMDIMKEETFGPVMPVMSVNSDEEAIQLMNDSKYGLTASIWTTNTLEANDIAQHINTGTVFTNKCDYLDPSLPWSGVKETGIGCSLSYLGFHQVTRPKSYYTQKSPTN